MYNRVESWPCIYDVYVARSSFRPCTRVCVGPGPGIIDHVFRSPPPAQCPYTYVRECASMHALRGSSAYRKHELLKKREYGQRVRDVERGVFTPIVFTTTGGMGREAATFYKRLADMIAGKQQKPYSTVMGWLRCRLSFATLRSAIYVCSRQQVLPPPPNTCTGHNPRNS